MEYISIPTWALVFVVGSIATVIGWGVRRLVSTGDATAKALGSIVDHLGKINGRLGKCEQWQTLHKESDDERHEHSDNTHKELWQAINSR